MYVCNCHVCGWGGKVGKGRQGKAKECIYVWGRGVLIKWKGIYVCGRRGGLIKWKGMYVYEGRGGLLNGKGMYVCGGEV